MTDDPHDRELVTRFKTGDQGAAQVLFDRFVERLISLVRPRFTHQLARRLDPEDVVQSAFRSFFSALEASKIHLASDGDLWPILAEITLRKLRQRCRFHHRQRRDFRQECPLEEEAAASAPAGRDVLLAAALASEPSPQEAQVAFQEILDLCLAGLSPRDRSLIELALQGAHDSELAAGASCAERTVRRVREDFKKTLLRRLRSDDAGSAVEEGP
jgi:RNA polymerase sigma-70 factor (ECF subfamily)